MPEPSPLQRLAASVIRQAVVDATSAHLPEATRQQARAFLLESDALTFWADVLNVPVTTLRQMARETLDGPRLAPAIRREGPRRPMFGLRMARALAERAG